MKELMQYRAELIDRLVDASHRFRDQSLALHDPFAPFDDGWNAHQIAAHTRDVDKLVYGTRARRTAAEDNPEFPNFDGERYMAEHYSAQEPLEKIVNELVENVEALAQMLRNVPVAAWSRQSRHVTLGHGFTMQTWVERGLAHIEEHLKTIQAHQQ
jgi:hypothetical protein